MASKVITLSLPLKFLREIDRLAKQEGRPRSEIMREGFRRYLADAERWNQIRMWGKNSASKLGVKSEEDVYRIINAYRRKSSRKTRRRARRA